MAGAAQSRAAAVLDKVPDCEWWDAHILRNGSYDDVSDGRWDIKPDKITPYVEHPVPMKPPMEAPRAAAAAQAHEARAEEAEDAAAAAAREQEKQEMIRQGLLEPPKPKVKISNLMRVLTDEATADPTAIEKEVRKQMEERSALTRPKPRGSNPGGATREEDSQAVRRSVRRRGDSGARVQGGVAVEPEEQVQGGHKRAGEQAVG